LHNVGQISKMAGGNPVIAVLKNNAYGLGDTQVAKILDTSPNIAAIAVVKDERAIALRKEGVTKPILLMGDFDNSLASILVKKEITLSIFSKETFEKINALTEKSNKTVEVALYIDTGLGRMGIPLQETIDIAKKVKNNNRLKIAQTFSTLTTPKDFAEEQIKRFKFITKELVELGIPTGLKHLAPSYSLIELPKSPISFKGSISPQGSCNSSGKA